MQFALVFHVDIMIDQTTPLFNCFLIMKKLLIGYHRTNFPQFWNNWKWGNSIIKLIKNLCENQNAIMSLRERITDPVPIRKGIRQGCLLSTSLFNAYSETMMDEATRKIIWKSVNGEQICSIKFADDQAVIKR